ncbi:hypothetical protein JOF56_002569 [Kibdelosporangium banguiense]|uniref:TolA protein n=1 Tax=Kibdelosporangium banguiense TaxID=1365924 RepID=A0ABS4TCN4_9PSEU|nr:hypothetical protein [Kibdelosporangium banguiense]MBP2322184.1 hypothetical protein [Kibdelosporangium banguiense]
MKRSLGVLSRAVLVSVSAAVLVAPAALAATPPGAPAAEQQQNKETLQERLDAFIKRADQLEKDAAEATTAVAKAKTQDEAKKAKQAAVKVKSEAATMRQDMQAFLDDKSLEWTTDLRVKAAQTLSRSDRAAESAEKAIAAADKKIKDLEPAPAPAKGEIAVEPSSAARGSLVVIVVFCPEGKVSGFASEAIDLVSGSRYDEDNVSAMGGFVKKDATVGQHTATATCGTDKLTATFTVTPDAPVQAKPPTADDVRRKTVLKPKGKIETGGGATAQFSI